MMRKTGERQDEAPLWLWRLHTPVEDAARLLEELETAWQAGMEEEAACRWLAGSITGLPEDPRVGDRAMIEILLAGDGLPDAAHLEELVRQATDRDGRAGRSAATLEPPTRLAPRDWVSESQRALAPVALGRLFIHGRHDRQRRRGYGLDLEIEAGEAFGTGHHGTTLGCLAQLEAMARAGARMRPGRVLEVGSGSGILALAACRLWHVPVIAGDIDPVACRVLKSHMRTNSVPRLAHARGRGTGILALVSAGTDHPMIRRGAPYDLVIANILRGPLMAMADQLVNALAPGGRLLLSGLLTRQMRSVVAHYRARGLVLERCLPVEGWASLLMRHDAGADRRPLPAIARPRTG